MQRGRAYLLSPDPLETPLSGREAFGCNCYSSGEAVHTECIIPRCYGSMLGFFQLVADVPGYQELEAVEFAGAENGDGDGQAEPAAKGFVIDYQDGKEATWS